MNRMCERSAGWIVAGAIGMAALASGAEGAGGILPAARTAADCADLELFDLALTLSDGIREAGDLRESWTSSQEQAGPHWAELQFAEPVSIQAVAIHWPVKDGVAWTSRQYKLQRWEGDPQNPKKGEYKDILEVKDNPAAPFSLHAFNAVKTDRLRVWQPASGGPSGHENRMGIAEIEAYDYPKAKGEFGTATDQAQRRRIEAGARSRTIGVFKRSRHQPRTKAILANLPRTGMQTLQLDRLGARELKRCRIVVLAGPRVVPNRDALLDYIHNGGAVLFIHDACGRSGGSLLPEVWGYAGLGRCELVVKDGGHPVAAGLTNRFAHAYADHAQLKAGRNGKVVLADAEGKAVVVAGQMGGGKVIAMGNFPGLASEPDGTGIKSRIAGDEGTLLKNSIAWLAEGTELREEWEESPAAARLRKQAAAQKLPFTDVTAACGLEYRWYSKAVAMADAHETGRLDLFATLCGPPFDQEVDHNLFYRNEGNWKFTEVSKEAGIRRPNGIGCVFGDLNGDGHLDLVVSYMSEMGNRGRNGVFVGDGKGGFRDVTDASGLGKTGHSAQSLMSDVDNDGDLDLYLVGNGVENTLWRNRGDGTFEDVTASVGLAGLGSSGQKGYGDNLAAMMADMDGDGFQDLICLRQGRLAFFRNTAGRGFEQVPEYMGPGKPITAGGGFAVGDIDRDGDLDLYALGGNALLRNDGNFEFSNITPNSGLDRLERNIGAYCPIFLDWDNDGALDLFIGSGVFDTFLFHNNGDGTFADVTGLIGLDAYSIHGANFGDLDGDGDLDGYASSWSRYDFKLFRNNQDDGNYLKIRVKGRKTNTSGIGAKVWVYAEGGPLQRRRLQGYRELLGGGGSMYTCPVLEQHVGVPAGGPYTVEVYFPVSGKRAARSGVTAPQTLMIEED